MKWIKGMIIWVKSHIVVSSIIGVVVVGSIIETLIIINSTNENSKEKLEDKNNSYIKMLCSNEYDDGEKVNLEFVYDFIGKKLKKHILNHTEIGLSEEDEWFCTRFDLLSGISCSFDKTDEQYKYTIEFNIDEFDNESREMINEYENYNYLLSLSMIEAKNYLIEDESYNGMVCKVIDESGNVIQEEKNVSLKKDDNVDEPKSEENKNNVDVSYAQYIGEYYDTTNPTVNDLYTLELKSNGKYTAWVNFGISSVNLTGTYTINGNNLILNASERDDYYKIGKTTFVINGNSLTFKSGGISDETAQNIGCSTGNFDCTDVKILYKK